MRGHQHLGDPSLTQNQGNLLGDRPCVRQSRLYREHDGGNAMKELMGKGDLKWDTTQTQGVYSGGRAFDHNASKDMDGVDAVGHQQLEKRQQQQQNLPHTDEEEEVLISIDEGEADCDSTNQSPTAQQAQQFSSFPQKQQEPPTGVPVTGRTFRPGAGYANRQTYNIFTGISARVMPKEEEEVVYCDAFMRVAFAEAQKALAEGEVPVGCVLVPVEASCEVNAGLVDDEEGSDVVRRLIAARGRNATNKERHALAHAEFVAVEALLHDAAMRGVEAPANLAGYVLYVVVEPCIMCAAMLLYNRVRKVYFGCGNPRFGGNGTVLAVHNAQAANAPGYESHGGHRADQAVALLQEFYRHENANAPGHKRRRKGS